MQGAHEPGSSSRWRITRYQEHKIARQTRRFQVNTVIVLAMASIQANDLPHIAWPRRLVHGIYHYHRQWIPGDERGFRSRDHRIHSSGDYKNPPPPHEHEGLRRWINNNMTGEPVALAVDQRAVVGAAFIKKLQQMKCLVLIVACGPTHVHVLFEPTDDDVDRQVGRAKQFASLKCPNHTGQLWAESGDSIPVSDLDHAQAAFGYIDKHRNEGAWIWRFDQDAPPV